MIGICCDCSRMLKQDEVMLTREGEEICPYCGGEVAWELTEYFKEGD